MLLLACSPIIMPRRTLGCESSYIRDSKGPFKIWLSGKTRAQDPRDSSRKGLYKHLTSDFKKLKGRDPKVGEIHRCIDKDGSYCTQVFCYIRTPHGWRRSKTEQRKPTPAQVKAQMSRSRPRRT